jgi:hypothetical protein
MRKAKSSPVSLVKPVEPPPIVKRTPAEKVAEQAEKALEAVKARIAARATDPDAKPPWYWSMRQKKELTLADREAALDEREEKQARNRAMRKYNDALCYARKKGLPEPKRPETFDEMSEAEIQRRARLVREGKL